MTSAFLNQALRARWVLGGGLVIAMATLALGEALRSHRVPEPAPARAPASPAAAASMTKSHDVSRATVTPAPKRERPPGPALSRAPDDLPDTPAGHHLKAYLEAAGGGGDDAERRAHVALERLRGAGSAGTKLVLETYRALPEERYLARWMMIDTLSELGDHQALEDLEEIAEQPIPEERFTQTEGAHGGPSSVGEETKIRWAAVRGIAALAELGNRDAERALREVATRAEEPVRQKAVLAYLDQGVDRRARKAELMGILPPSSRWMARVPVIPAGELPPLSPPERPERPAKITKGAAEDTPTVPFSTEGEP